MPELPEIQAHAERLTADFGGRRLKKFVALSFTALKTYAPPPDDAYGQPIVRVGRRGKYLLVEFETVRFVVHLMQGGRLKPDEKQSAKPRGGLARWVFDDGPALTLTEAGTEKKAGVWVIPIDADVGAETTAEPFVGLGPDADTLSADDLRALLAAHSMRLHGFLRDQHILAGLGRRLANEICHRAKLSPFANTAKITAATDEVERLHAAVNACLDESLAYERSRDDMSSSKERPGAVHHRDGEPCPVCGDNVRAVEYNRYTVNYCATCQTNGKVLADNTTSKFLK
jgi:formamidopyrimidine-DNA glycosylase